MTASNNFDGCSGMGDGRDLVRPMNASPERPVPYAGDEACLSWAPGPGSVSVDVRTSADGIALFSVRAPADVAMTALRNARMALIRGMGGDPTDPSAEAKLRAQVGNVDFEARLAAMVRKPLFALAVMRTQILPFLAPYHLGSDLPREGKDFLFQTRCMLRPRAGLSSYEPVSASLPPASERDERSAELIDALSDLLAQRLTGQPMQRHVDMLRDEMANRFAESVEREGTSWQDYVSAPDFDMDAFKEQMAQAALTSLRRGMALDALAARLGVRVEESDLLAVAGQVAAGRERGALEAMLQSGQLPQLCEVSRRGKAAEWLLSTAVNAEPSGERA